MSKTHNIICLLIFVLANNLTKKIVGTEITATLNHETSAPLKPVLVTGAPRSGTTWVGRMLALSHDLYYVHEPFNPDRGVGRDICNVSFERYFTYITEQDEVQYYSPIKRMLDGKYNAYLGFRNAHTISGFKRVLDRSREFSRYRQQSVLPLIKDPIAIMSAGWIARRFDVNVVVMIRHPAAFVASMKRLNWPFRPSRWALSQPNLMKDYLYPFEDQLKELQAQKQDIIAQSVLMWNVIHHVILRYKEEHADWIFLRHEDISLDPIKHFQRLYKKLGLEFNEDVSAAIQSYSQDSNPDQASGKEITIRLNSQANISSWKHRLSPSEIERIRPQVEAIAGNFYSDSDW